MHTSKTVFMSNLNKRDDFLTIKQHNFLTNILKLYKEDFLVKTNYFRLILKQTDEFIGNELDSLIEYLSNNGALDYMVGLYGEFYKRDEIKAEETLNNLKSFYHKLMFNMASEEIKTMKESFPILTIELKDKCLCLNNSENMKFDLLEILGNRILEVYRILIKATSGQEEFFQENGDKFPVKVKQMNIFLYRNLSYQNKFNPDEIPKNIKNYFRQIGVPCLDAKIYLLNALNNFAIDNAEEVANKIMYTISYANKKIEGTQRFNLPFILINKIIVELLSKINDIKPKNKYEIIRHMIKDLYQSLMNGNEYEEFRKFLNEVYEMKDYEGDLNPEYNIPDENISKAIKDELATFKFNNQNFEQRVYQIFSALSEFDCFTFVGQPITGKSQLFLILSEITKKLNEIDSVKYAKMLAIKIYP
jgi:hypothetical protein